MCKGTPYRNPILGYRKQLDCSANCKDASGDIYIDNYAKSCMTNPNVCYNQRIKRIQNKNGCIDESYNYSTNQYLTRRCSTAEQQEYFLSSNSVKDQKNMFKKCNNCSFDENGVCTSCKISKAKCVTIYKRSNRKFNRQGGVSGGSRINRLKYQSRMKAQTRRINNKNNIINAKYPASLYAAGKPLALRDNTCKNPRPVIITSVVPGDYSFTIYWKNGDIPCAAKVDGYTLERTGSPYGHKIRLNANQNSYTYNFPNDPKLLGVTYDIRIRTENFYGPGVWTYYYKNSFNTGPSAPKDLDLSWNSTGDIKLKWSKPEKNGGSEITSWKIRYFHGKRFIIKGNNYDDEIIIENDARLKDGINFKYNINDGNIDNNIHIESGLVTFEIAGINSAGLGCFGLTQVKNINFVPNSPHLKKLPIDGIGCASSDYNLYWIPSDVVGMSDISGYILKWNESTSEDISSANITSTTRDISLNDITYNNTNPFGDISTKKGETYDFTLITQNLQGFKSPPSNKISVTFPKDPINNVVFNGWTQNIERKDDQASDGNFYQKQYVDISNNWDFNFGNKVGERDIDFSKINVDISMNGNSQETITDKSDKIFDKRVIIGIPIQISLTFVNKCEYTSDTKLSNVYIPYAKPFDVYNWYGSGSNPRFFRANHDKNSNKITLEWQYNEHFFSAADPRNIPSSNYINSGGYPVSHYEISGNNISPNAKYIDTSTGVSKTFEISNDSLGIQKYQIRVVNSNPNTANDINKSEWSQIVEVHIGEPAPQITTFKRKNLAFISSVSVYNGIDCIVKSSDGINWEDIGVDKNFFTDLNDIKYYNGKWVAVGKGTEYGNENNYFIASSNNGFTWTKGTFKDDGNDYKDEHAEGLSLEHDGNENWIVVGKNKSKNLIFHSTDGDEWSKIIIGPSDSMNSSSPNVNNTNGLTFDIAGVTFGNNLWIFYGEGQRKIYSDIFLLPVSSSSTGHSMLYSYNGIDWEGLGIIFNTQNERLNAVKWNGEIWVAVGKSNTTAIIGYSMDGLNWTQVAGNPFGNNNQFAVDLEWNGEKWLAITDGGKIIESYDGKNWTNLSSSGIANNFSSFGIAYGNNKWLLFGETSPQSNNNIYYSTDNGINWTPTSSPFQNYANRGYYNERTWIAVGTGSSNNIALSTDGISWTGKSSDIGYGEDILYGNNIWVAVGTNGAVYSTNDGVTWTSTTGTPSDTLEGVTWNKNLNLWVVSNGSSASSSDFFYSNDGINWLNIAKNTSLLPTGYGAKLSTGISYVYKRKPIFTYKNDGNFKSPSDWQSQNIAGLDDFNSINRIVFDGDIFLACGEPRQSGDDVVYWTKKEEQNWIEVEETNSLDMTQGNDIFYNNNIWIIVGQGSNNQNDNIAWINNPSDLNKGFMSSWNKSNGAALPGVKGVSWSEKHKLWVASPFMPGNFLYSTDGKSWNTGTKATNFSSKAMGAGFIAPASSSQIEFVWDKLDYTGHDISYNLQYSHSSTFNPIVDTFNVNAFLTNDEPPLLLPSNNTNVMDFKEKQTFFRLKYGNELDFNIYSNIAGPAYWDASAKIGVTISDNKYILSWPDASKPAYSIYNVNYHIIYNNHQKTMDASSIEIDTSLLKNKSKTPVFVEALSPFTIGNSTDPLLNINLVYPLSPDKPVSNQAVVLSDRATIKIKWGNPTWKGLYELKSTFTNVEFKYVIKVTKNNALKKTEEVSYDSGKVNYEKEITLDITQHNNWGRYYVNITSVVTYEGVEYTSHSLTYGMHPKLYLGFKSADIDAIFKPSVANLKILTTDFSYYNDIGDFRYYLYYKTPREMIGGKDKGEFFLGNSSYNVIFDEVEILLIGPGGHGGKGTTGAPFGPVQKLGGGGGGAGGYYIQKYTNWKAGSQEQKLTLHIPKLDDSSLNVDVAIANNPNDINLLSKAGSGLMGDSAKFPASNDSYNPVGGTLVDSSNPKFGSTGGGSGLVIFLGELSKVLWAGAGGGGINGDGTEAMRDLNGSGGKGITGSEGAIEDAGRLNEFVNAIRHMSMSFDGTNYSNT